VNPAVMAALAAALLAAVSSTVAQPSPLPPVFDAYLKSTVHPNESERKTLLAGDPVTKLLDSDASKEVAVFGSVWIRASSAAYVERVKDIERFESGGAFRITKRISDPPSANDFAELTLPDEDVQALRDCEVGDCEVKLGADALQTFRTQVPWDKSSANADATSIFRRLALEYVTGYRTGGNEKLAVYRDKDRPVFVANEFRSMIDRLPPLAAHLPEMKHYLLEYPGATLSGSSDFLYWQEAQFGLKPTIRISHLIVQQQPEQTVVASKMLYATHYFWTALELRILLPDASRGNGFWFITVSRSRSDGLSGFTGRVVSSRVRSEVQSGTLAALRATKTMLESASR
jgi:hypothetical protein